MKAFAVLVLISFVCNAPAHATVMPSGDCSGRVGGSFHGHAVIGHGNQTCDAGSADQGAVSVPQPPTRTYDCGPRSAAGGVVNPQGDLNCSQTLSKCMLAPGEVAAPNTVVTMTQTQQPDGSWLITDINCNVPAGKAGLTGAEVRQEAEKLVPHPAIGVAPPNGTTLVNIETLLWVDTAGARNLGTVTLLGHQVQLSVEVASVAWNFGDGQSTVTSDPGVPYDKAHPCSTKLCDRYWGHVYTKTGRLNLTATVSWTGSYRVDGGPPQPIPGAVTGPASTMALTVREARSVLVRD